MGLIASVVIGACLKRPPTHKIPYFRTGQKLASLLLRLIFLLYFKEELIAKVVFLDEFQDQASRILHFIPGNSKVLLIFVEYIVQTGLTMKHIFATLTRTISVSVVGKRWSPSWMRFYKLVSSQLLDRLPEFQRYSTLVTGQHLCTGILALTTKDTLTETVQWPGLRYHRQLD